MTDKLHIKLKFIFIASADSGVQGGTIMANLYEVTFSILGDDGRPHLSIDFVKADSTEAVYKYYSKYNPKGANCPNIVRVLNISSLATSRETDTRFRLIK